MTITTLDQVIAGAKPSQFVTKLASGTLVAGRPFTPLFLGGQPGAATAPTPGIGGAAVTSLAGAIPFTNPTGGNWQYLSRFSGASTSPGVLVLCDLLWWNSGINATLTTEQTFTGAAQIPERDNNGANLGDGVFGGLLVSTATGAGTPTVTFKYTNSAGTQDRTATNIQATAASSPAGTFYQFGLAAGDVGVQRAQSIQLSATWTSGSIHAVLYRPVAVLELATASIPNAVDAISGGLPRLYNNSVLFPLLIPATTTSSTISASLVYTEG